MREFTVGVIILLFLVGGCTSTGGDAGKHEEPPATVSSNVDTRTLALPLDGYTVSPAEFQGINEARQRLASDCAKRFGFDWSPPRAVANTDSQPVKHDGQWGHTDEARAQKYGYKATPDEYPELERDKQTGQQKQSESGQKMSPALAAVLGMKPPDGAPPVAGQTGPMPTAVIGQQIPDGGCLGEADRKLREGAPANLDLNYPSQLAYEAENRTWADSRVVAKVEAWRACMTSAGGYEYPTPTEAAADPAWRSEDYTAPPSAKEVSVAVADARCNNQVGLSDTAAAVDAAYHNEFVEKNSQQLASFRDAKDRILRNAAAVLGR